MFISNQNEEQFIVEEIKHLPTLTEKLQQVAKAERNAISRRLASRFAQLHEFGYDTSFSSDDLRISGSSERPEIWFCHLDEVTLSSPLTITQITTSFQKLYHDLSTLKLISHSDTLRFLKRYTSHHSGIHWKQLFRRGIASDVASMTK